MLLKTRISQLQRALQESTSYAQWQERAEELDAMTGLDLWRLEMESEDYDFRLIRERLQQLRAYQRQPDLCDLVRALREGLHHDLGNMGNPMLYGRAHHGTKHLIEDYIDQVCESLEYVAQHEIACLPIDQKIKFFRETAQSFGQPALMLSGGATLGLFHIGVCKALQEQDLLPEVISGSSAGSLMAAMIGTHTDEELRALYDGDDFFMHAWNWRHWYRGFFGEGFAEQAQLEQFLRRNIGEYSFGEAYARTGRHINVTVSPVNMLHKPRLMNELTSPYLFVWSAVLASCAVPLIFPPVTLTTQDGEGHELPYMPGQLWVDGSVKSDLPRTRLTHLYDVNFFIAVQVNPHVVPFMLDDRDRLERDRLMSWPARILREELKFHGSGVLNFLRHQMKHEATRQLFDHAYSIISQRYNGDVTIVPPGYRLHHYRHMLRDPNARIWRQFRLEGERATWPKIAMIRSHIRIARTLKRCLHDLENNRQRRQNDVIDLHRDLGQH